MKKKLTLKQLEVKSFVTALDQDKIKGGAGDQNTPQCFIPSIYLSCIVTGAVICG